MAQNINFLFDSGNQYYQDSKSLFLTVLPLAALAMLNPRFGLICVLAIVPNFLISVGGAEKTGFSTLPHVVCAFFLAGGAVGLMSLKHFLVRYSPDKAKTIIATFLAVIGI